MHSRALYYFLLFIIPIFLTAAVPGTAPPAYTATDLILLNCGESSDSKDYGSQRTWNGDEGSKYAPLNAAAISNASQASVSPDFKVPYATARVFNSTFTYNFPLSLGPKFLRLYFYPDVYSGFDTSQSLLDATANGFTLLKNFSAFLCSKNQSKSGFFMKEFVVNIGENQRLNLTLVPGGENSSAAFINGIEIVSIPEGLYFKGNDVPIKFVDQTSYLKNVTVLETLYRLNVGGGRIEIQEDSGPIRGMFRAWEVDDAYLAGDPNWTPHKYGLRINYKNETPPYTAPKGVYTTCRVMANYSKSIDWSFPVDSGFYYLLRLHFCEITLEVTEQNQRVFTIAVDGRNEEIQADVINWAGGTQIPIFRDYIAFVNDDGRRGQKDLLLSLFPNLEGQPKYSSALLNGLEIFKLSDGNHSLAAANPELSPVVASPGKPLDENKGGGRSMFYVIIGSVIGVLAVVGVASFLIFRRRRKVKDSGGTAHGSSWVQLSVESRSTNRTSRSSASLPSDLCRYFFLDEIKAATLNFDDNLIIGRGGFGNVYKGLIDGATTVAIKRLNSTSNQGAREFLTEIEMLSKLRHLHLVSLIGYCDEYEEMILVYDYMSKGSLRSHLYNSHNLPLAWKQRLQACLGAAKGLHYLHTGAKPSVIHRDVKTTNILLDEKFVAKMSDFGLSKVGPTGGTHTHVSTVVKGSFGYVDPEYYKRQRLTDKSDVYSFGVVLLEILCARPPIIPTVPKEQVNLAEWAKISFRKGKLEGIIDSNLDGQIAPESLMKFVEIALNCVRDRGVDRPAMSDVVWSLEFAMQLQDTAESGGGGGESVYVPLSPSQPLLRMGDQAISTDDQDIFSKSGEAAGSRTSELSTSSSEKLKSGDVFSELINPVGR